MKKIISWIIENLDFFLTVVIASTVAILASLNFIPLNFISTTILGVLITLTLYSAIKNYRLGNKINSISNNVLNIEQRIKNISTTRVLSGTEEFFGTVNMIMTEQSKLDVTYFTPIPPNEINGYEIQKYWKNISQYLKKNPNFRVRRIVTIENIQKLEWLEKTINDSKNSPNYHIAVLNTKNKFPLLNLVVVDSKYVVLFGPHIQWSDAHYIYVENTDIASVVTEYFNELWRVSDILKVGSNFNQEKLNIIKSSFVVK